LPFLAWLYVELNELIIITANDVPIAVCIKYSLGMESGKNANKIGTTTIPPPKPNMLDSTPIKIPINENIKNEKPTNNHLSLLIFIWIIS